MFRKIGFILVLILLFSITAQKTFAITYQIFPSALYLLPTPSPTPFKFILPSGLFKTIAPSTPTPTPTPTLMPINSPTPTSTTTQTTGTSATPTPTNQPSPSASPQATPTPTPSQQTMVAGLTKESLLATGIILLIFVIILLTQWNKIKHWLNKKTTEPTKPV